jgi:hypothetical protein
VAAAEKPLLINSSVLNPQDYIGFRDENPYPITGRIYGKTTIKALGLDRETLNETRRSKLALIKNFLDCTAIADNRPDDVELQKLAEEAKHNLKQQTTLTAEFSAMVSAFVLAMSSLVVENFLFSTQSLI